MKGLLACTERARRAGILFPVLVSRTLSKVWEQERKTCDNILKTMDHLMFLTLWEHLGTRMDGEPRLSH
jgi:hypothetical protein